MAEAPGDFLRNPDMFSKRNAEFGDMVASAMRGGVCTNSGNDYTLTFSFPIRTLIVGVGFIFMPSATNTGAATLTIRSRNRSNVETVIGPYNLRKGDGSVVLEAGNVVITQMCWVIWDGTQFQTQTAAEVGPNSSITSLSNLTLLRVKAGGSTATARVGGCLFDHYADASNVTTTETDLYSDTLPANVFQGNGDKMEIQYAGTWLVSLTATRRMRVYVGGTMIFDSGALTVTLSGSWVIELSIVRASATTLRCSIAMASKGLSLSVNGNYQVVSGLNLGAGQIVKVTGQAGGIGSASGDITASMGVGYWYGAQ